MVTQATFPARPGDGIFLTEGGIETELMYKWGFELPHFSAFPLLDNPDAVSVLRDMYRRSLDVMAANGMGAMLTGLDYRASPDWGKLLGYSPQGLADANHQAIEFLRNVAREYEAQIPSTLVGGIVGPRGDAYQLNRRTTAEEAEDYHSVQLSTLKDAQVDFACAMTFNNIPEAVGVARAAQRIGVPLVISLTVDSSSRLKSGPSVAEAVNTIDEQTDAAPVCYMLNCSHPQEFEPGIEDGDWILRMRGFRPNASKMDKIALCELGHLEEGDPEELGRLMGVLSSRYPHMDIWGGCCGTGHVHLEQIARNVRAARELLN